MGPLVITFREGIEVALVIGIMLAFVRKTDRGGLGRWVLGGTVAGVLFSIAAAVALGLSGVTTDDPVVEGILYVAATVAVLTMVVWMWRSRGGASGRVESRIRRILDSDASTRRVGLSVALLAFFMVAREGVEMLLFVSAGALGGAGGPSLVIGAATGLGLAVVYGVLFARGSALIDLRLFFTSTSIVLLLLAAKLLGASIHEFEEAGILAMSEAMAHFFDAFGGSAVVDWLFLAALAVPLGLPLAQRALRGHATAAGRA
jgi:high-affinity iron transporter